MIDLTKTIEPKSDQLNADDLISGPRTIKITKVSILGEEQPIGINFEGDNGKPYKPCKSMRRVLVKIWGADGNKYIGRSLTIYRDDKVRFGAADVGGIRISHMSDIDEPVTLALTASRTSRKPYTVHPLHVDKVDIDFLIAQGREAASQGKEKFMEWYNLPDVKKHRNLIKPHMEEFKALTDSTVKVETAEIVSE